MAGRSEIGHIVIVDGGGSGTRVRLLDKDGTPLAEGKAGPSSLTLGIDQAWQNVSRAIEEAATRAGRASTRGLRLWGAFAGAGVSRRERAFIEADPLGCAEIVLMGDGRASLEGAFAGGPGAVLAIGTGVIALAKGADGEHRWAGGWGFPVGDEGGGAWIGCSAVGALSAHIDGRGRLSPGLARSLTRAVGQDYFAVQDWLTGADATKFATLAPHVVDTAENGDPSGRRLLERAAKHCEKALFAVAPEGPAALLGGLAKPLTPYLSSELRDRLQAPRGNALDGLRLLALAGAAVGSDFRGEPA